MEESEVRRAVEAARLTARPLGLRVDDLVVLHNSDRIALRLMPCDVLVRVAPAPQHADSVFEVEVTRQLAGTDGPVAGLDPRVEARAHFQDGFAISFWTYFEPVGLTVTSAEYTDAMTRMHAALRQIELQAPHCVDRVAGALREIEDREQTPALLDSDREFLSNTLSGLSRSIGRQSAGHQLLHGEPHPGNLLNTKKGPLFIDLATCCRGPIEFDVAHAPEEVRDNYSGADQDLLHQCRVLSLGLFTIWRWRSDDQLPNRDYWRMDGLYQMRAALNRYGLDMA